MSESAHYAFAYQPILNAAQASVAVELIYRDTGSNVEAEKAANAVLSAFVHSGLEDLLRLRRAFVRTSSVLLNSELLNLLPPERFALEVKPQDVASNGERCAELRALGYRLVMDAAMSTSLGDTVSQVDVIKLNADWALSGTQDAVIAAAFAHGVQLYAWGVEQREAFDALEARGFHLYQGYHFARPSQIQGERTDPRKLSVLDLLGKLASDADDRVLEESFKTDPVLSLHLLRLVNSSAFALPTKIRSIKHAFAILGRGPLSRWLQVLLFVLHGDSGNSPLLELALRRARFMEYVLTFRTHHTHSLLQDEAYMVGLLSLTDVLMGWTMEQVTSRLSLAEELRDALVNRNRPLGHLITLCEALERADFDTVAQIAEELQLPLEAIESSQQEALAYAHRVSQGVTPSAQ